jgi:hypothetical protein
MLQERPETRLKPYGMHSGGDTLPWNYALLREALAL